MESIQSSSCAVELKCKADKSKWHVKCFPKNSKSGVKRLEIIFSHFFPGTFTCPSPLWLDVPCCFQPSGRPNRWNGVGGGVYSRGGSLSLFMIPVCVRSCWKRGCLLPSLMSCQVITLKFGPRRNFKRQSPPGWRFKRVNPPPPLRISLPHWTLHQVCGGRGLGGAGRISALSFQRVKESLSGFSLSHWKDLCGKSNLSWAMTQ